MLFLFDPGESEIYGVDPTWDFFVDAVKEQYFPVGNYED
jgi:hypothetical protein